jgi:hypothetical protein
MFASDEEGNIMDAHIDWGAHGIVLAPQIPRRLTAADSLADVRTDSAVALLKALRSTMDGAPEDTKMYYDLLTIKAEDKTYVTHRSDKQIMRLVNY